nr:MAG TPA: hypothetical protein [Crassvirales sp.]
MSSILDSFKNSDTDNPDSERAFQKLVNKVLS